MRSVHQEFCLMSVRVGFGGRHHLCCRAEAAFQPHATECHASHHRCDEHGPLQDDKVNCTEGRQSAVIEILAEQNLVCVIIVCQALAEAKIHST